MEQAWNLYKVNPSVVVSNINSNILKESVSQFFYGIKEYLWGNVGIIKQKESLKRGDYFVKKEKYITQLDQWNSYEENIIAFEMLSKYQNTNSVGDYKYKKINVLTPEEEDLLIDCFSED